MKAHNPQTIGSAISSFLREAGIGGTLKQYQVLDAWPSIVGEQIASVAIPEKVENGTLYLRVTRSTWRNELQYLKPELIARINKEMHQDVITDIIFR